MKNTTSLDKWRKLSELYCKDILIIVILNIIDNIFEIIGGNKLIIIIER